MNYRTVVSFGDKNIDYLLEKYAKLLEGPRKKGIMKAHISGALFGYS